ncbi:restriction endonuclease subunit S [Faecalicoccus pleomorphus]|uniref:restriction endonuclease subunit S n=1 Tax=Faecalicoccus pleomorphus TaxID=1323 RepID=UPI00232EE294|nr:restriction endonuclease subunit S [Faecalicoccus pleomorphus]MDB7987975.1 restriction endonuclease subunit S [Faecalicoccus pleomorphus]MDB7992325.1 restriction endonuclease subunit S [Faecalicoccus pleomorphus]
MKSNYDILGNHIRLIDTRNRESITDRVLGINIDKFFMPSVANVIGTDLSKYKLITKGKFACNPIHVGRDERLPVALYDEEKPAIVSPAYFMFEVIDNSILNEDYLMMWFRRPEFDRICWLHTDGSVRGGITWDDICRLELPIPPIENQLEIVNSYKAITERIALKQKINDNLDATIYAKFQDMFQKNKEILFSGEQLEDWCIKPLSFLADFKYGKMATSEILCEKGFPVYSGYRIVGYCNKYMFKEPQLVVLARGVSGTGEVRISPPCCHLTNLSIAVLLYDRTYINYLLYYLENDNLISLDSGSAQSQITINDLSMHKVMLPPYSKVVEFDNIAKQLRSIIDENNKEIEVLEELKKVLLTTISSR